MKTHRRARSRPAGAISASQTAGPKAATTTATARAALPLPALALERWRATPLLSLSFPPERSRRGGASLLRERIVVFRLAAPDARSVQLAAEFTDWEEHAVSLGRTGDGEWEVKVRLAPGEYGYRFLVDGQWHDDPRCPRRKPNPFGTTDAVAEVG